MDNEEIVQVLANLYPAGIPPESYEDVVALAVARLRADMFRKKKLVNGQWIDADGVADHVDRMPEIVASKQPPASGIRGGGRRYDLPSESDVRGLERSDASRYPSMRSIAEKVQRDLSSGALKVHDAALSGTVPVVEVPNGKGKMIVPRHQVPETELRRIDRDDAARTAEKFQYREPVDIQVGTPRPVSHAAPGEKIVSFQDIYNGPSMPKPVGG